MITNEIDTFSSTHDHKVHNKGDKNIEVDDHDLLSRITVRKFELSDVDDFMLWAGDPELGRFTNWESPESREDATMMVMSRMFPHLWYRSICVDDRSIGEVSVTPTTGSCRAEIGYSLGRDYRGKGIVTHVVKFVSRCVFIDSPMIMRDVERLEGFVDVENLASRRVLEKAGFVREGVLRKYLLLNGISRDAIVYSLLSTECI